MTATQRQLIASPVFERLRALGTPKDMAERLAFEFADTYGAEALVVLNDNTSLADHEAQQLAVAAELFDN